jgi:hypothetical protein
MKATLSETLGGGGALVKRHPSSTRLLEVRVARSGRAPVCCIFDTIFHRIFGANLEA